MYCITLSNSCTLRSLLQTIWQQHYILMGTILSQLSQREGVGYYVMEYGGILLLCGIGIKWIIVHEYYKYIRSQKEYLRIR